MPTLIVTPPATLPSAPTACAAVWFDGTTVLRQTESPLAQLIPADGTDTVVLVPGHLLSWHLLQLPRGTLARAGDGTRLRAVLQGMLEEHLLDEVDNLHLALQPQAQDAAPVWVAACQRAWLKAWLDALEQAGHTVSRIVPEYHPLPSGEPTRLVVQGEADAPTLVACSDQGVALLPLDNHTLELLDADTRNQAPVQAEPSVADAAERAFAGRAQLQTRADRALLAANGAWDLAQLDLVRSRSTRLRKQMGAALQAFWNAPPWRPARWAVLALVLVNLAGVQVLAWKEQSALTAKREAIRSVLTSTFPDVRLVVDAPVQMTRALADLQRQNGAAAQSDLETMLGQFQALAPEFTAPSAIEFVANELRMQGTGITAANLPALNNRLQGARYQARLEGDQLVLRAEVRQ